MPTQINHQGVVSVNGQRFNGTGSFYFAIIDPATGNSVWTNDATNIGTTNRPSQPVTIACVNGLYDVRLGDLSLVNMKAIPVSVFSSEERKLRIWFDDGTNGIFQLTPDHTLTSVPYAYRAAETGGGVPRTVVYTANDTWIKPQGLKYIEVELVGGGGAGGSGAGTDGTGGGGGGGGYSRKIIAAAALGPTETVTVGTAGNTSSFGSHCSATGGGNGGNGSQNNLGDGGTGGVGSGGDFNAHGQGGGGGSRDPGSSSIQVLGGVGGSSLLGGGGGAATYPTGSGGNYGGGGAGGYAVGGGGGASGVVIVKEYF